MSENVPSLVKPLTTAKTSNIVAIPRNPSRGEAAIQEFVNSSLTSEQLRQRAAPLLNNKELLRDVQGLTREDRKKFVDKVDEVGRGDPFFSLKIFPPLLSQRHIRPSTRKTRNS